MPAEQEKYRCREIMGNLHMLFGMDSVAVEEEEAFAHARNCPHCRTNLQVAAKLSGFGRKLAAQPVPTRKLPAQAQQVRRLFDQGVQENRRRLANAFYEIGRSLIVEGAECDVRLEFAKPIKPKELAFAEAEILKKSSALTVSHLLPALMKKGIPGGRRAIQVALELVPNHEAAKGWLGNSYGFEKDWERAEKIFMSAQKDSKSLTGYVAALINLGWIYEQQGLVERALPYFKEAMQQDTDFVQSSLNAFLISSRLQDFVTAESAAGKLSSWSDRLPGKFQDLRKKFQSNRKTSFWIMWKKNPMWRKRVEMSCPILFEVEVL